MKIIVGAIAAIVCLNAKPSIAAEFVSNLDGASFSSPLQQISVPSDFISWREGYEGTIYLCHCSDLTINLSGDDSGFDFYLKPNQFGVADFSILLTDITDAISSSNYQLDGINDATAIALKSTTRITSVEIKSADILDEGFAIGEFQAIAQSPISVPEQSDAVGIMLMGIFVIFSRSNKFDKLS